jgi:hypothetical protein
VADRSWFNTYGRSKEKISHTLGTELNYLTNFLISICFETLQYLRSIYATAKAKAVATMILQQCPDPNVCNISGRWIGTGHALSDLISLQTLVSIP